MTRLFLIRAALLLGLSALVACNAPPAVDPGSSKTGSLARGSREAAAFSGPTRDLSQDEAAGGHVLRKHVGRTDDELRERLAEESHIAGASTYTDRPTAEHAIGAAIAQSQDRVQRWLSRFGGHPNLVLDYDSPQPIGRTLNRGESQTHPCAHALVVLKYDDPGSYHVLTSYPECRR